MKQHSIFTLALSLFIVTYFVSCSKDDDKEIVPPDYSDKIVGLWNLENKSFGDAVYFGENGEAFVLYYGDLGTIQFVVEDYNSYSFENNYISYYLFGSDSIPYNGTDTLAIPGNSLTKVNGIKTLSDIAQPLDLDAGIKVDISSFLGDDKYNNLDGFGDELFIPNPSSDENRYLKFNKNNLTFIEAVTDVGKNARSIGIIDDLLPMRSILEYNRFRIYQPTNPAYHPAIDDIPVSGNVINTHAVTNNSGWDFISYNQQTKTFRYHDVSSTNKVNGIEDFAFFSLPGSLNIYGMDYVENENILIFSDSFNLHVFNIGFSGGTGVSVFQHIASYTILPSYFNGEIKGRIHGVYYDSSEQWLFLVIENDYLVRMDFELPK